ncbi:hypothetical protein COMA2_20332 [Candidatus Nitrospira nitrificans]|uniref:Uncharacterized protein n=1 Tax=Candidatus Nitrospira nitrificans TaxID=1742973 RepID=A0A0S4LFZ8_9BACT|nr:hypothetical protein COMA2_20332 [Candidatus Nitrospira nitrificans]
MQGHAFISQSAAQHSFERNSFPAEAEHYTEDGHTFSLAWAGIR